VGDFYLPIDFVILDMPENSRSQIILSRPFLATVGCKTNVKEEKMTFDVGENHAEFGLFKDCESSPFNFSRCGCEAFVLHEHVNLLDVCPNDPSSFNYDLFRHQGLDSVKVEPLPPCTIKDEPYAVDEGYLSDCYGFVTLIFSMPTLNGAKNEFDMDDEFDFRKGRPSDGTRATIIAFIDSTLWKFSKLKKDLNSKSFKVVTFSIRI